MHDTREEAAVTDTTNEPQSEAQTPTLSPKEEAPEVIDGEVMVIAQPEQTTDHPMLRQHPYWLLIPLTIVLCLVFGAASFL